VPLENYRHYSRLVRYVVEDPEKWLHEAQARGYWSEP
jgi:hypothetical protein